MDKNKLYTAITSLAIMVSFISCDKGLTNNSDFVPAIVVDGSIESNNYPRVFLTRNIPYYVSIDSADLIYLVLRQAKVTVSEGKNSEILTLVYDKDLFPPFYYRGTEMTGEAGKTYDLKVEYGSTVLTASTTIPMPVHADSVWFKLKDDEPDLGEILVKIKDPLEKNYYKIYTSIEGKQKDFYPALIPNYDDRFFNGQTYTFHLQEGPESYLNLNQKDFYFSAKDTVFVKLCTLDEQSFAFWNSYQNEVTNGANPFASSFHEVKSNIKGDALGIWCGFGTTIYKVKPK